jgi:hypothetical protein
MPKLTEINNLATSFVLLCNHGTNTNCYNNNYYISVPIIGRRTARSDT